MEQGIFKAYDIRGVFGEDFVAADAARIGAAVAVHTHARRVLVGRDMRTSSPELAAAVTRGVTATGADVVDIGLCSTPMFNVAVAADDRIEAGIMVSASHNPAQYNGFKLDYGDGLPISSATGMEEVKRLALSGMTPNRSDGVRGTVETADVLDAYLARVTALVNPASLAPLRMVVDCGNGMGGLTMPRLAPQMRGDIERLFWELDGTFPNHGPNPIKAENVADLTAAVRTSGADVGFAYDGDADRLGVVDDRGALVRGDLLTVLLAREALRAHPGATVLYDLRASRVVAEEVRKAGGVPVPTRVGHALIKKHIRETGAVFAGELSNHFYFSEFWGVESTEYAMLLLLRILTTSGRKLSELVAPLARYHHSGEVNFEVVEKDAVLRALEERYAASAREVAHLDGLTIDMGVWWCNVRPSNTESLLRLVVETPSERETEVKVAELTRIIEGR